MSNRQSYRGRILVVDDEVGPAKEVTSILRRSGYSVKVLNDPSEALEVISNSPESLDVVIVDHNMPEMTGPQLVTEAQKESNLPFIVMSETADREGVIGAFRAGAKRYLLKPISEGELVNDVDEVLAMARWESPRIREKYAQDLSDAVTKLWELNAVVSGDSPMRIPESRTALRESAYDLTWLLARTLPSSMRRTIDDETTETGILIFTKDAPSNATTRQYVVKNLKAKERVVQAYEDSRHFEGDPVMLIESMFPPLYSADRPDGWLWKEHIQGPNVTKLLFRIGEEKEAGNTDSRLDQLTKLCFKLGIERTCYWQQKAPEIPHVNDDVDLTCKAIVDSYHKNLVESLRAFDKFTDVAIPEEAFEFYGNKCLDALGFSELVTEETIGRNFASTYRNMKLRSEVPEKDLPTRLHEILDEFTVGGKISREEVERNFVHVDTVGKYSHLLEDIVEMMDSLELGMDEKRRKRVIGKIIASYDEGKHEGLTSAVGPLRHYRGVRKGHFFLQHFGLKAYKKSRRGDITLDQYHKRMRHFEENISHYLTIATDNLDKLVAEKQKKLEAYLDRADVQAIDTLSSAENYLIGLYHRDDFKELLNGRITTTAVETYRKHHQVLSSKITMLRKRDAKQELIEGYETMRDYLRLNFMRSVWKQVADYTQINYRVLPGAK